MSKTSKRRRKARRAGQPTSEHSRARRVTEEAVNMVLAFGRATIEWENGMPRRVVAPPAHPKSTTLGAAARIVVDDPYAARALVASRHAEGEDR